MNKNKLKILQENDKNGFETEKLRRLLALERRFRELEKTYTDKYPSIPDKNSPEFWDEKFLKPFSDRHFMEEHRNLLISKWLVKLNKNVILDIGCGRANVESLLYSKFKSKFNLIGTDITNTSLKKNIKKFPQWKFIQANPKSLPFKNKSFDVVLLLEVLEHITPTNTFHILKEVHRVLKHDGYFILSIPLNEGLEEMFPNNPNSHVRVYSKELVLFELTHAGFDPLNIIELSAFSRNYYFKHFVNSILKIRKPNNLIILSRKRS